MKLAIRIEITLKTALFVVASDHGNFLLRKSLITLFPIPKRKEYKEEISMERKKLSTVFSSVKNKKKNIPVPRDTQSSMIKFLRFISKFLGSKLAFIKGIKNYFLPNGRFFLPSCTMKKSSRYWKTFYIRIYYSVYFFAVVWLKKYSASDFPQFGSSGDLVV
jgi:hypothetical protein